MSTLDNNDDAVAVPFHTDEGNNDNFSRIEAAAATPAPAQMEDSDGIIEQGLDEEAAPPVAAPRGDYYLGNGHSLEQQQQQYGDGEDSLNKYMNSSYLETAETTRISSDLDDNENQDKSGNPGIAKNEDSSTCPVCLEDYDNNNNDYCENGNENYNDLESGAGGPTQRVTLSGACNHSFCRNCLRQHCHYAIKARRVPITCPRWSAAAATTTTTDAVGLSCDQHVPDDTVQTVLLENSCTAKNSGQDLIRVWQRYQTLLRLSRDSSLVECPSCEHLVRTTTARSSDTLITNNDKNDLHCPACQESFCRIHGHSHAGISCAAFFATPAARLLEQTERTLQAWTKPCSHCGCRLQKAAGCDHVVCASCGNDLCWKCGTHVHLTGKLVRHCAKCQRDYRDHRYDRLYRLRLALCLPLLLPLLVVYSVLALVVAIATGCFCGCFQCGRCLEFNKQQQPALAAADGSTIPATDAAGSAAAAAVAVNNTESATAAATTTASTANNNNNNNNDDSSTKTRGSARHGVWTTIVVICLPVIALLEDFGIHVQILDELFPEPLRHNEMPFLEVVEGNNTTETTDIITQLEP